MSRLFEGKFLTPFTDANEWCSDNRTDEEKKNGLLHFLDNQGQLYSLFTTPSTYAYACRGKKRRYEFPDSKQEHVEKKQQTLDCHVESNNKHEDLSLFLNYEVKTKSKKHKLSKHKYEEKKGKKLSSLYRLLPKRRKTKDKKCSKTKERRRKDLTFDNDPEDDAFWDSYYEENYWNDYWNNEDMQVYREPPSPSLAPFYCSWDDSEDEAWDVDWY